MPTRDTKYPCGITRRDSARDFHAGYLYRLDQPTLTEWRSHQPCGYHAQPAQQPVMRRYTTAGGLVLQGATQQSHTRHDLIRPDQRCWDEARIREMSSLETLTEIGVDIIAPLMFERKANSFRLVQYIGRQSGMSQPDFHIHVLTNPETSEGLTPSEEMLELFRRSELVVLQHGNIKVVCESIFRVGQCFIVPLDPHLPAKPGDIVYAVYHTARLFALAFPSTAAGKEGLSPDYSFVLDFVGDKFNHGVFNPCLAPLGAEQTVMGIFPEVVIPHQWTPERTLQLLGLR